VRVVISGFLSVHTGCDSGSIGHNGEGWGGRFGPVQLGLGAMGNGSGSGSRASHRVHRMWAASVRAACW
jgi:hypothetical protein